MDALRREILEDSRMGPRPDGSNGFTAGAEDPDRDLLDPPERAGVLLEAGGAGGSSAGATVGHGGTTSSSSSTPPAGTGADATGGGRAGPAAGRDQTSTSAEGGKEWSKGGGGGHVLGGTSNLGLGLAAGLGPPGEEDSRTEEGLG